MNADIHVLTGAYACDALDPGELSAFEDHLAHCEACAQEVAELRATAAALAAAEAIEPPAALRERVMNQIVVTRQLPPLVTPLVTPADQSSDQSSDPSAAPSSAESSGPRSRPPGSSAKPGYFASRRGARHGGVGRGGVGPSGTAPSGTGPGRDGRRWTRVGGWVAAAALLIGMVFLGGVVNHQRNEINALNGQTTAMAQLLAAPDAHLTAGKVTSGGTATVVSSGADNGMVFTASGLPALPPGKAYQLWMINGTEVRPGPVLTPVDGKIPAVFAGNLDGAQTIAMTVEPSAGSAQPTTTPILQLSIST